MNIVKIYLVKYGTRLAYINLEDFSIPILSYLIEHGYKIEPVSEYIEL